MVLDPSALGGLERVQRPQRYLSDKELDHKRL
jgi:hypothetical protein